MRILMLVAVLLVLLSGTAFAQYDAPAAPDCPAGSAQIVFVSDRDGDSEIFVMDADGGNVTQLTNNFGQDFSPRWSPDGTQIAFTSDSAGNRDVWVMDADGSNLTQVTNTTSEESYPIWNADGTQLIYTIYADGDGSGDLHIINVDGSNEQRLIDSDGGAFAAAISPDGTGLAWEDDNFGGFYNVYVMRNYINIPNNIAITESDTNHSFGFSWSPDGKQAVFNYGGVPGNATYIIHVDETLDIDIEADGFVVTDFTDNIAVPVWSPDGRQIVFSVDNGRASDVYVIDRDGSNMTNLTNNSSAQDYYPDWRACSAG